jgi:aquaporin Z
MAFIPPLARAVAAEACGTGLFLFVTLSAVINYPIADDGVPLLEPLGIATVFGLTITVVCYALGEVSGAHLNPAVTIAFFVRRVIDLKKATLYIVAQIFGGISGAAMARLVCNWDLYNASGKAVNHVVSGHALWQGLLAELFATLFLVTVVLRVAANAVKLKGHGPIAVGGVVLVCHLALIPITGTSINPSRSIAEAVVSGSDSLNQFLHLWIFIVGPIAGGLVAGFNSLWEETPFPNYKPAKPYLQASDSDDIRRARQNEASEELQL